MQRLTPLNKYVVLEPIESDGRSAGGLYLAPTSVIQHARARVVEIGNDVTDVTIGDTVIYDTLGEIPMTFGKVKVVIVRFANLITIVHPEGV